MKAPQIKRRVLKAVADYFAYCFQVIDSGVMPYTGFYNEPFSNTSKRGELAGKPIMGKWKLVYSGSKSDGKARKEMNNFKRWWKCLHVCDSCDAQNPTCEHFEPDLSYTNFGIDAMWRDTIITHDEYMLRDNDVSPFSVIEGWRKEMVLRDWLHLDPLGVGRDVGGSLIKSFYKRGELGPGTIDEQLRVLWGEITAEEKVSGYLTPAGCGLDNLYHTLNNGACI